MSKSSISIYLAYVLRHNPGELSLEMHMDNHGWVPVDLLIQAVNRKGKYHLTREMLNEIVRTDNKGRYRFDTDGLRIKACQGHSIPWVEPELEYKTPPGILYHGTTWEAYKRIAESGCIDKMGRHAVHLTAMESRAWQSARRRKVKAAVLIIDAAAMCRQGYEFGVSENGVWCTEVIPKVFITGVLLEDGYGGSKEGSLLE